MWKICLKNARHVIDHIILTSTFRFETKSLYFVIDWKRLDVDEFLKNDDEIKRVKIANKFNIFVF